MEIELEKVVGKKNVKEKEKNKLKFLIFNFYSKFLLYIDNWKVCIKIYMVVILS